MSISAPKVRVFAEMAALACARPASTSGQEVAATRDSRYLAALAALGIESPALRALVRVCPPASVVAVANDPSGRFAQVAVFYERLLEAVRRDNPDMPESNVRHIAQRETIIANRSLFPPGALFLLPELGEAGLASGRGSEEVPAVAAPEQSYQEWQ